jgi:ABC-type antimicrobial peptide transport system permease subunit
MSSKCMIYVSTFLYNFFYRLYHISHDMDVNNINDVCLEATNVLDSEKEFFSDSTDILYILFDLFCSNYSW